MTTYYSNFYSFLNKNRRYIPLIIDAFIAIFSYILPYVISGIEPIKIQIIKDTVLIYALVYIGVFWVLRIYKNMWRYTGIVELCHCLCASTIANIFFCLIVRVFDLEILHYIYVVVIPVSSLLSMTARIMFRALLIIGKDYNKEKNENSIKVMIVGAGQATSIMLGEIKNNSKHKYSVKCIVDDDPSKIGRKIESIPVVGNTSSIVEMANKYEVDKIIISIPSIDPANKKRIVSICTETQCRLKILPEIYSLISKDNGDLLSKLRDVQLDDLLGREPITLDCQITKDYITNKVVLVTGGGGSIGSELCRQIASYKPKKLIILDIYENNAYYIQQELIRSYGDSLDLEVQIASVRDKNKLEKVFKSKGIDIVFHAAAHKHVPLMENNPEEAIKNNIIGTYNTVLMADKYKSKKFVLVSTDKAVNPTNIMGATKRICEMIVQAYNSHSTTDFVAVRFGNVLGSNGSVIPHFMEQIKNGGPVTVTHEEITRYFMTIPEAVQLVLRAAVIANGGEIFVLDMGQPVKIKDLAYNLIKLAGLIPDKDIKIEYTGLRPGEKLYEELLITNENNQEKTEIDKIFVEQSLYIDEQMLFENIYKLQMAAANMDIEMEIKLIEGLVPSYKRTPNDSASKKENRPKESIINIKENEYLLEVVSGRV